MPVGLSPQTAADVNNNTGSVCRSFVTTRDNVHSQQEWLLATDLTATPYNMDPADQTTIKSALSTLDAALQAVDMTFVSRLIGLPFQ